MPSGRFEAVKFPRQYTREAAASRNNRRAVLERTENLLVHVLS